MRWADQVGAGTVSPTPVLWSRSQGWTRSSPGEGLAAEEAPTPSGTLRRVETGTWRGDEPPAALFEGPTRIATPSVGPVRVTMTSGELFEGDLEAVGQGRIWLRTSLGSLSLETGRTETVERLDPGQVERTGLESRDHDHAGKPHVRVIAPGGVFSGRLLRQEGCHHPLGGRRFPHHPPRRSHGRPDRGELRQPAPGRGLTSEPSKGRSPLGGTCGSIRRRDPSARQIGSPRACPGGADD